MSKTLSILLILLAIIAITYGRSTGFKTTDQGLKFSNEAKVYQRKDESGFEASLHLNIDLNSNSEDDNTGEGNTGEDCTDEDNTGEDNTGEDNTGEDNTGEDNTGEGNTGEDNTGEDCTDEENTGEDNTGEDNTGEGNTGEGNTGTSTGEGNTQGGRCDYYWTKFYNRDHPSATGDWELLSNLRSENRGEICETPISIEAQLTDGRPAAASGNNITISPTIGLFCKNIDQGKGSGVHCNNFKVRFLCLNETVSGNTGEDNTGEDNTGTSTGTSTGEGNTQGGRCDYYWTKFYNRDHPSATGDWETLRDLRSENRGEICETPISIEAQLTDGRPAAVSGNNITISPTIGLICKNIDQGKGSGVHCNNFKVRFLCLNETVSGNNTVGKITVGKITVGKSTVGKITVGKSTVGKITVGKSTVGKITVGKSTVGKNTVEKKNTVGLGKARATDV